jgi:hypothetical protein
MPSREFARSVSIPTLHVSLPLIVGYQKNRFRRRGPLTGSSWQPSSKTE